MVVHNGLVVGSYSFDEAQNRAQSLAGSGYAGEFPGSWTAAQVQNWAQNNRPDLVSGQQNTTQTQQTSGASMVWQGPDGLYRVMVNGNETYSTGDRGEAESFAQRYSNYMGMQDSSSMSLSDAMNATSQVNDTLPDPPVTDNPLGEPDGGYPDELTGLSGFNEASSEVQSLVNLFWNMMNNESGASAEDAAQALQEAVDMADPHFASLINYTQDEIRRTIGGLDEDLQTQIERLQARRDQINQDLSFNREQIGLEEQAEMAKLARQYDRELRQVQSQAQESGTVFSSPRELAESELEQEVTAATESTQRVFGRQMRNLEVGAERQIEGLTQSEEDARTQTARGIMDIARRGELELGTSDMPNVSGVDVPTLGGLTGTLQADKDAMILNLQSQLMNRLRPETL